MTIRANTSSGLSTTIASVAFYQNDILLAHSELVGQLEADVVPERVVTRSGASGGVAAARLGTYSGEMSLTMRERPDFVDTLFSEGTSTTTAASSGVSIGAVTSVRGTSLSGVTVVAASVDQVYNFQLTATGSDKLIVEWAGSAGAKEIEEFTPGATANAATPLGSTGVSIWIASPNFTDNDVAVFSVRPPHRGIDTITVPAIRRGSEFEMVAYTAKGNNVSDTMKAYTFQRVLPAGAAISIAGEGQSDTTIPLQLIDPEDGSWPYRVEILRPTA